MTRPTLAWGLIAAGLAAAHSLGCQGAVGTACLATQCLPGEVCVDDECRAPCDLSLDCPRPDQHCVNTVCVEVDDPECHADADCAAPPACQFAAPGACRVGRCTYSQGSAGIACDDGDACTSADTCDDGGACVGAPVVCDAPPPDQCSANDDVFLSYRQTGTCVPTTGGCAYTVEQTPCPSCASDCLSACAATPCPDPEGGCLTAGVCLPGPPATCSYLDRDGGSCDLSGPGAADGRCAAGTCVELDQDLPLEVAVAGGGDGSVTSSPGGIDCGAVCSADFPFAEVVVLSAAPGAGSRFSGWSGDCAGDDPSCPLVLDAARSVTAYFEPLAVTATHTLAISPTGGGQGLVISAPAGIDCGGVCSATFDEGTPVTLGAAATPGSSFQGWSGEGCTGLATCVVAMSQDRSVSAAFARDCALPWGGSIGHGQAVTAYAAAAVSCGGSCGGANQETRVCDDGQLSGSFGNPGCGAPACAACALPWGGTLAHGESVPAYQSDAMPCGGSCGGANVETRTCTDGVLSGSFGNAACSAPACASCALPWGGSIAHLEAVPAYQSASPACGGSCGGGNTETRTCTNGTLSGSFANPTCAVAPCLSCSLPWGGTVAHGGQVEAFRDSLLQCGQTCTSELRSCNNGILSGSFGAQGCGFTSCSACSPLTAGIGIAETATTRLIRRDPIFSLAQCSDACAAAGADGCSLLPGGGDAGCWMWECDGTCSTYAHGLWAANPNCQ